MNTRSSSKRKSLGKNHFIIKAPVVSGSMMPLIKEKSQVLANFNRQQSYQLGDIVIFLERGKLAAHRIINTKDSYFILKGDNNSGIDGSFEANQLFGKVEKIIYPEYTINLNDRKNRFLKHFFVLYSRLNLKFSCLLKIRELYRIPLLKFFYRQLLKEIPKKS